MSVAVNVDELFVVCLVHALHKVVRDNLYDKTLPYELCKCPSKLFLSFMSFITVKM